MNELVIYRCEICGNLAIMLNHSGLAPRCCLKNMTLLKPNTTDGASEKHVPVITRSGNNVKVSVGSAAHPMLPEHMIEWIILHTNKGYSCRRLEAGTAPEACFTLTDGEEVIAAYAWCNLHELWIGK